MNILVCIKQVPDTAEIKIDPVTNTLIRAGVPSIVNPFDAYALEIAARIKDKNPGTKIVLVSMGPQQATAAASTRVRPTSTSRRTAQCTITPQRPQAMTCCSTARPLRSRMQKR